MLPYELIIISQHKYITKFNIQLFNAHISINYCRYEVLNSRDTSRNYVADSIGKFTPCSSLGLEDDYPSH